LQSSSVSANILTDTNAKSSYQYSNYAARVLAVHNLVYTRMGRGKIDSLGLLNHSLLDSLRVEILKHKDKDSLTALKATLDNGMKDSLVLIQVKNLLNSVSYSETGSLNIQCVNYKNQKPLDSVKITISLNDTLLGTHYTAKGGICIISNLKQGKYSLGFSKDNYSSYLDNWITVSPGENTTIIMPLLKTSGFFLLPYSIYTWGIIAVSVILLFVLVYVIVNKFTKHA
jgi:hypothetical protein